MSGAICKSAAKNKTRYLAFKAKRSRQTMAAGNFSVDVYDIRF